MPNYSTYLLISPKGVRYCRISLCCMPRVRGGEGKGHRDYVVPSLKCTNYIFNWMFCLLTTFTWNKKKISFNIKETELACAGQIYLEYFLPSTPLLTPSPPDIKEEKQMIIRTKILKCLRKDTSQSMLLWPPRYTIKSLEFKNWKLTLFPLNSQKWSTCNFSL